MSDWTSVPVIAQINIHAKSAGEETELPWATEPPTP